MSTAIIPPMRNAFALASSAQWVLPRRLCSSPVKAMKTSVWFHCERGQHARALQDDRDPARVVVGAGGVGGRVHHVGRARIEMAADHEADVLGAGRAGENRDHVGQTRGRGDALLGLLVPGVPHHLQPPAVGCGDAVELRAHPARGGADATGGRRGVGERVTGAERGQTPDVGLDPCRGNLLDRLSDLIDGGRGRRPASPPPRDQRKATGQRHRRRPQTSASQPTFAEVSLACRNRSM